MRPGAIALISSLLLVACGGSDPGVGSKTLYVDARAETDGSSNGTVLRAVVRLGSNQGDPVDDASVIMKSDRGVEYALVHFAGFYVKGDITWEPGWRMRVSRGNDHLEAYLKAPGVTVITEPLRGSVFSRSASRAMLVRWRDESGRGADSFEVNLRRAELNVARPGDPGSIEIDSTQLVSSSDERIRLTRISQVNLAGGAPGSTFKAESKADLELTVQ